MITHNISSCFRKSEILIMLPDLALLATLIGSNHPCLELILMVPKVFEPLKFDCTYQIYVFSYFLLVPLFAGICVNRDHMTSYC